ncbi:MAG: hypothetical protein DWB45_02255 [Xanthomonadales bacterium]|nr:hypothetical protein [Xanthomonadales bacterium]MDL1868539.1 tetratricopeptide repeat protein [Gammaproteobacteria bacterium PRO6]
MRFLFPLRGGAAVLAALVAALLAGCASPAPRRSAAAAPVETMVRPVAAEHDLLARLLVAQFALQHDDVAGAAQGYAQAAAQAQDPAVAEAATQLALAQHDWALAQRALARWQTLAPDAPGVVQAQAWIALGQGRGDEALRHLQQLAARDDEQGWRLVAQMLMNAPDKIAAAVLLARLVAAAPVQDKESNAIAVSQLAYRLGDASLARRLADASVRRFHGEDGYAWSAHLASVAKDGARARAIYDEALKQHAGSRRLRTGYAALLAQEGDNAAAARLLAVGPQDQASYAARAAYAARADDKQLMARLYRELEAAPGRRDGERLFLLGQLAEMLDKARAALDWYGAIRDGDERHFDAQMRSAIVLDGASRTDEAIATLQRLFAHSQGNPERQRDLRLLQADILGKRGRDAQTLAVYAQALQDQPDDARVLYSRALYRIGKGELDAGERDLRRIVELQPDNADALNALGYTIADHAKDDTARQQEALALIKRALELKPDEPAIIDSMGWVQYRLGQLDAALKDLRRAYAKQADPDIAAHLGEVLWVKGEHAEARKVWEAAREKHADNKALLETIERLSR